MVNLRHAGWVLVLVALPMAAQARAIVVKQALNQTTAGKQLLTNGDLEKLQDGRIADVKPWEKGYEVDPAVVRGGKVSARVTITDVNAGQHGLTYPVVLNQQRPMPFTAELWSKAQDVSGTPDNNYSLYIDLTYMDGTPQWGQVSPFAVGTHDWQKRTVTVVPEKPVREVSFHAIFRFHTGTAWFDDFAFYVLDLPAGCSVFDGIPISKAAPTPIPISGQPIRLENLRSQWPFGLALDAATGAWVGPDKRSGGLFVRDASRRSDFRQPLGIVKKTAGGAHFEATDEELGLKLVADYTMRTTGQAAIVVKGVIEDLTGRDRGVSVYCALPIAKAEVWHDDMRSTQTIEPDRTYSHTTTVGCGANGRMSLYPFATVARDSGVALGAPLDPPTLYRFAYDSGAQQLYGVEDLGLTKDSKTPSKASFSFVLFPITRGGFRGGLSAYYRLFPDSFTKRTTAEGNWMAFDDIAAVTDPEDFHFAFKEGTNNPAFDEAHGVLTYTYVEPASYWMAMADLPRTPQAALELLAKQAAQQPPQPNASATMTSAVQLADGSTQMSLEDTPWCDGALFILNPDPDIPTTPQYPVNQGMLLWKSIQGGLGEGGPEATIGGWRGWEAGYEAAPGQGRDGSQAAVVNRPTVGAGHGMSQSLSIRQDKPGKIIVSAWCKGEGVTGEADKDFSLYCDLTLADGQPSWGHTTPFSLGTYDWEQQQVVIDLPQRVMTMSLHLLFRGNHTGKAWFDDVSVTVEGSDNDLAQNGGLEPKQISVARVDGAYIDSLEMGASMLDFDRRHWIAADAPLVFTTDEGLPAELLMFGSYEFIKDVSEKMHAQGRTIFANAALHRFAQCAGVLDLMGTETNWNWQGKWTPMRDADCNFKRALCYQRPYLLLQNTVFEDFPVEMVEKYMKRAIFYGLFPSFFSHNAADRTYWTRPEMYNRDRHLFKKYLPVAQAISAAGWEPLTFATTGNEKVYIERWGTGDNLYFTLFNDSDQPQEYGLEIELHSLVQRGKTKALRDVLSGRDVPCDIQPEWLKVKGTLGPEDLRVFKVAP